MSDAPDRNDGEARSQAEARSQVYALLSALFDGEVELLEEAIETGLFERLAESISADPDVNALVESSLDAEALRAGYDNLFVVPGPHYVPPFASGHVVEPGEEFESDSLFRDDDAPGELLGQPAAVAAGAYERFGFSPTRGADFPDSLPAILEFASSLAAAEMRATCPEELSELRKFQLTFVQTQLWWVDAFADEVANVDAAEGVYAALADFTRAFVAHDRDYLRGAVERAAGHRVSNH